MTEKKETKDKLKFPSPIVAVFLEPVRLVKEIAQEHSILLPFIIILLLSLSSSLEKQTIDLQIFNNPLTSLIFNFLGSLGGWIIAGGAYYLVIKILGGQGTFKKMLILLGYANLISLLNAALTQIGFQLTGKLFFLSPLDFLPQEMQMTSLGLILNLLNPLTIYQNVFMALGFIHINKLSKLKAIILVCILYLLPPLFLLLLPS